MADEIREPGLQRCEKLRRLEDENRRLKQLVVKQALDIQALKVITAKKLAMPKVKRTAALLLVARFWLSQRRVWRLVGLNRNTLRYRSRRSDDQGLPGEDASDRHDCLRIYVWLRREGWRGNHKKVERLYREEGLSLRRRVRRKAAGFSRVALPKPTKLEPCYAMNFVHDRLVTGRLVKCLTMTDPWPIEVPVIEGTCRLVGRGGCRILDRLFITRPLQETLDNGHEFAGTALDAWIAQHRGTCISFSWVSRCRMRISNALTARFEMNVSTSTGL